MMTDVTFVPLLEKLTDRLPSIERYVVLTDAAHLPSTRLKNAVPYEEWMAEVDGDFAWKMFDENTAAGMCYTSGTTGNPKGVVYSHRSNVLHSMIASAPDTMGISCRDVVMPVVPMFHANCWGLALTTPMQGAALVMPGAKLDGASIYELLNEYRVSFTAAVPTVRLMLTIPRGQQPETALPEEGRDRRLRLSARHDQDVPARLWRGGLPRLGHDRNVATRDARFVEAGIREAQRRGTARCSRQAGTSAIWSGDENH
jgi:acyl-CoA synthetase (AMP-forming)/AMP-acid ligase II